MKAQCSECHSDILNKDVIALNKKLINRNVKNFLCLECMSEIFGCTSEDLENKIEQFKDEGCKLF